MVVGGWLQLHARQEASGGGVEVEGVGIEDTFPSGLIAVHTSRNKVITHLVQGSRLIPVLAQTPGRDLSNTKGSVQRPELNLWFSLVKVQLAEAYSQYFTDISNSTQTLQTGGNLELCSSWAFIADTQC